jgi:hypothetical protein
MIMDDDLDQMSHEPVDENSLGAILGRALKDIDHMGGVSRQKLADLVGRDRYNMLLGKPRVADAIDRYLTASPQTKKSAGRMLAMHVARSSDHPELVDRVERELADTFSDEYGQPSRLQRLGKEQLTKVRSQQRSTQRVADPLLESAKQDDITQYRAMRLRGQQRQRRHGIG